MASNPTELATIMQAAANGDSSKFIAWATSKNISPQQLSQAIGAQGGAQTAQAAPSSMANPPGWIGDVGNAISNAGKNVGAAFNKPVDRSLLNSVLPPSTTNPQYPMNGTQTGGVVAPAAAAPAPPAAAPAPMPVPTPAPPAPAAITAPIGTDAWLKEITAMSGQTAPTSAVGGKTGSTDQIAPTLGASGSNVPAGPEQADVVDTGPPLNMDNFGLGAPISGNPALAAFAPIAANPTAPTAPLSAAPSEIGMSNIAPVSSNWADLATAQAVAPSTAMAGGTDWSKVASGLEGIEPPANPDVLKPSTPSLPQRNALPTNLTIPALLAAIRTSRPAGLKLS